MTTSDIIQPMNTGDLLNIFLIIGLIILVICVVFVTYYFVQALRTVQSLAEDLKDTTLGIKQKLQMRAFAVIPSVLAALISRVFRKRR